MENVEPWVLDPQSWRFMMLVRATWYVSYVRNKNRVLLWSIYRSMHQWSSHQRENSPCSVFIWCCQPSHEYESVFVFVFFLLFSVFHRKKAGGKISGRETGVVRGLQEFHCRDFEGFQQVLSFVLQWSHFWMLCFAGVSVRLVSCSDVITAQSLSINRKREMGWGDRRGWTRKKRKKL